MAHLRWAAIALALFWAGTAFARPYTVKDLLGLEGLGEVLIAPGARWLVVQTYGPWSTASRFDLDLQSQESTSRLEIFAIKGGLERRQVLEPTPKKALLPGPFSPGGDQMVVFGAGARGHELGILTLATGQVAWTGLMAHPNALGRSLQWRSEAYLVALVAPPGQVAPGADHFWRVQERLPRLWAASARGERAVSVLSAGKTANQPLPPRLQAVEIKAAGGEVRLLAEGAFDDLEISGSGRFLALIEAHAAQSAAELGSSGLSTASPLSQRRLVVLDLGKGRQSLVCPPCNLQGQVLSWSRSSDRLLFSSLDDATLPSNQPRLDASGPPTRTYGLWVWDAGSIGVRRDPQASEPGVPSKADRMPGPSLARPSGRAHSDQGSVLRHLDLLPQLTGEGSGLDLVQASWAGEAILAKGQAAGDLHKSASQTRAEASKDSATDQGSSGAGRWWVFEPAAADWHPRLLPIRDAALVAAGQDGAIFEGPEGLWHWQVKRGLRKATGPGRRMEPAIRTGQGWRTLLSPSADLAGLVVQRSSDGRVLSPMTHQPLGWQPKDGEALLAASIKAKVAVVVSRNPSGVSDLTFIDAKARRLRLGRINAALAGLQPAKVSLIETIGKDGARLQSLLFEPAAGPAGVPGQIKPGGTGRWPLVVIPYPGARYDPADPAFAPDALTFMANVQVLAGAGYAVLAAAMPIDPDQEPSKGLAAQILETVDAAARDHPVDPERIALWGQSYGGWAALMAATQSDRFAAIVASAPMTNLTSYYGYLPPQFSVGDELAVPIAAIAGWSEAGQGRMGVAPWIDPGRYVRNSPALQAGQIKAPVLLVYGDMDSDLSQAQSLYVSLARLGRDATLALYRGEGHLIVSPGNVEDLYGRVFQLLDRALRSAVPNPSGVQSSVSRSGGRDP